MTAADPRSTLRFVVPDRKLSHYCLATDHPDGGGKAKFFLSRGYSASTLEAALLACGRTGRLERTVSTAWGIRLEVRGLVDPPTGAAFHMLTFWQVDRGIPGTARFITAFLD